MFRPSLIASCGMRASPGKGGQSFGCKIILTLFLRTTMKNSSGRGNQCRWTQGPGACLAVSDSGQPVVYSQLWDQSHNPNARVQVIPWPSVGRRTLVELPVTMQPDKVVTGPVVQRLTAQPGERCVVSKDAGTTACQCPLLGGGTVATTASCHVCETPLGHFCGGRSCQSGAAVYGGSVQSQLSSCP